MYLCGVHTGIINKLAMKHRLNKYYEEREAALAAIREKYAPAAKARRSEIRLAEAKIELKKLSLKALEEEREKYRGIITAEARNQWYRLSAAIGNKQREIEQGKKDLALILTRTYE